MSYRYRFMHEVIDKIIGPTNPMHMLNNAAAYANAYIIYIYTPYYIVNGEKMGERLACPSHA